MALNKPGTKSHFMYAIQIYPYVSVVLFLALCFSGVEQTKLGLWFEADSFHKRKIFQLELICTLFFFQCSDV